MLTRRNVITFMALATAFAGAGPASGQEKTKVVATFSILGDLVKNVGGDRVELTTLVGPDGDAHVYSPSPADGRKLAEAKVVFANGLKYEGWIGRLVKSSGTKATTVEAARGVKTLTAEGEKGHAQAQAQAHGHARAHGHGEVDPHAWQNVANAKIYVANIRDALVVADPAGKAAYEASAAAYLDKLDNLDREARAAVAQIPAERRKIITAHDAFAYFEAAYGMDFIAPRGVSTEAEASAKDVARIIQQIRRDKIRAVFLENVSDPRLVEQIARETGAKIGGKLYSDALSPEGGPAATYIEMMRHNIGAFSTALSS
ncbi:MAG: Zinc ABC transporter, substrate-binding protein ZnuA [uncultured Microvirga sp.]|uniref:Zinc ABC transporter, substrate-binding protein ZnuA n=1 Tax=uncultured Microvirga sp. TaxID=412392 RepID=A0A6J4LRZ0_9HYPH|nr:MAG: Zinc ABC transporter, substrate-binding protein ZnuA [uncultured Microvirga sp.]